MTIDTNKTLVVAGSPWRLAFLGLLGICMTGLGLLLAIIDSGGFWEATAILLSRAFAALFFGSCTVIAFWRLATTDRVVLTLSPEGIRDSRVAVEFIPWRPVRGLSTWSSHGQNVLVLDVEPEVESRLTLTNTARCSRRANRALGADGLCVSAAGLKISYDELFPTAIAYAEAASRG